MSLLMKALKRAETAHTVPQPISHLSSGTTNSPSSASAHAKRDDRLRATAIWSALSLLVLGAGIYGYTLWRQPQPLLLSPSATPISVSPPVSPGGVTSERVIAQTPIEPPAPEMPAAAAPVEPVKPVAPAESERLTISAPPKIAPPARMAVPETNPQIAIHQNSDAPTASLQRAYQALKAGRTSQARTLYLAALADDNGVDALLGLAAIAANSGDTRQAAAYYRDALLREPNNSAALAGIAILASSGDPQAAQKPLERMAEKTDSASVRAALGNVYAGQAKWQAAQEAYFEAFRKEPENANHAYNLAVSLDQLGERTLALEYYRKALELGARGGAIYDAVSIERRIAELRPQ